MGKRYYANDGSGRSAPAWFMRPALIAGFLLIMLWIFWMGVYEGARSACRECRWEWDSFVSYWRSAR